MFVFLLIFRGLWRSTENADMVSSQLLVSLTARCDLFSCPTSHLRGLNAGKAGEIPASPL